MSTEELLAKWMTDYIKNSDANVLSIRRAEPRFQTHNYFARFKVETAKLDGTGQNPIDIRCVVVEVSQTDQTAVIAPSTTCPSIKDL
jgi:hypothetical protein